MGLGVGCMNLATDGRRRNWTQMRQFLATVTWFLGMGTQNNGARKQWGSGAWVGACKKRGNARGWFNHLFAFIYLFALFPTTTTSCCLYNQFWISIFMCRDLGMRTIIGGRFSLADIPPSRLVKICVLVAILGRPPKCREGLLMHGVAMITWR